MERLSRRAESNQRDVVGASFPGGAHPTSGETANGAGNGPRVQLDNEALGRNGYLTPETMDGPLAAQYGNLKRPLIRMAGGRGERSYEHANLIAITSALRGEGKTFTALNLAISIAMERDVFVVLVDADLIAGSLSRLVGLGHMPGLSDVLADSQMRLDHVVVQTDVPRLAIVPSGQIRRHTTELLASGEMRDLANSLAGLGGDRIALFDTAPILVASHATVLEELVGQVLVVVEEGGTPQQAVERAIAQLQRNKAVGMVLNKSSSLLKMDYALQYGIY